MKTNLEIAQELGITLKNIKTFNGHDGIGIDAVVCVNGKPIARLFDSAHGGCYEYQPVGKDYPKDAWAKIAEIEKLVASYPETEVSLGSSKFMMKPSLDGVCDALADEYETQKTVKKNEKKGLVLKNGDNISVVTFKAGTIDNMLKKYSREQVISLLKKTCEKYIAEGETILNLEYIKSLGVKL